MRNAEAAGTLAAPKLQLRIAINLGDTIVESDPGGAEDIYGDGVNIAARLQELAKPGGIVVSHTVLNHIRNKVALGFLALGERQLKNIDEPVAVYGVCIDDQAPVHR